MAWFGKNRNDEALDRLEDIATKLETDLRKVVIELSAAAAEQRVAADQLRDAALARLHSDAEIKEVEQAVHKEMDNARQAK